MHSQPSSNGHSSAKWFLTLDDRRLPAPRQHITEAVIRAQGSVPPEQVILRDHNSPDDEVLAAGTAVDLGAGNAFYTMPRCDVPASRVCGAPAKIAFSVDDRVEETLTHTQTKDSLLALFGLENNRALFRDYESPADQPIAPGEPVRYADGPVFYTRGVKADKGEITIDGKSYRVEPGNYTVAQLKALGGVAAAFELDQVVNGQLVPLPEGQPVCIRGGEVFISHPCSGGSS
jgi:hypothetical protein